MACNMLETSGQFWSVGKLEEFATTRTGRRPKNYVFTRLGWFAQTYGGVILAEGLDSEAEATAAGLAALRASR